MKSKAITTTAFLLFSLLCFMFTVSCASRWEKNVNRNGIAFKKIRLSSNEKSYTGYINRDIIFDGYNCRKGWIRFHKDWSIKSFVTTKDLTLSGNHIPAGAWIEFSREGRLRFCAFPGNTEVQGYICKGTRGSPNGFHTSFHSNGALHYFFPVTDIHFGDIPCRGGFFHNVSLYPDGTLKTCSLSKNIVIEGTSYKKGTKLEFNEASQVKK